MSDNNGAPEESPEPSNAGPTNEQQATSKGGGGGQKGSSGSNAGTLAGSVVIGGIVFSVPVAIMLLSSLLVIVIGGIVTAFGGIGGAMFGDENIRDQYGKFGCPGSPGGQPVTMTQKQYVDTIVGIGKTLKVSKKGQVVATMVALQESSLKNFANSGKNSRGNEISTPPGTAFWMKAVKLSLNYPHDAVSNDADSLGLFQQRLSAGWADDASFKAAKDPKKGVMRLLDPKWATWQFYGGKGGSKNKGLLEIPGWEDMSPSQAAQKVQASAFPFAYAKWQGKATSLVEASSSAPAIPLPSESGDGGGGDEGGDDEGNTAAPASGKAKGKIQIPMAKGTYRLTSGPGMRWGRMHKGQDFAAPVGTPMYAMADGTVKEAGFVGFGFENWIIIDHKIDGKKYSTVYGHMPLNTIKVKKGQKITAGTEIAGVGQEGNSTGPHLHFEIWQNGYPGGKFIDPMAFMKGNHAVGSAPVGGDGQPTDCGEGKTTGDEESPSGDSAAVLKAAKKYLGTPYSWGGGGLNGPTKGFGSGANTVGFDCSGLTRFAFYKGTGKSLELPRTSGEQYTKYAKKKVDKSDQSKWKPGDLVFYSKGGASGIYHVAIYEGGGKMIEAPRPGDVVKESKVRTKNLFGVVRVPMEKKA